jgi:hypothetical protein
MNIEDEDIVSLWYKKYIYIYSAIFWLWITVKKFPVHKYESLFIYMCVCCVCAVQNMNHPKKWLK